MHSEKVPYYILDLLQQVPSVHVPGLGRFDAIFHPAVIDLQESRIKPPYIQPDFINRSNPEDDMLPAYMHYVSGMDVDDAKEAISTFVNTVIHWLEEGKPYYIEKFGTFSRSHSDVLHFTPDWDAFNLSFSGLKTIDLHPAHLVKPTESISQPSVVISDQVRPTIEPDEFVPETSLKTEPPKAEESSEIEEERILTEEPDTTDSTSRMAWFILTSSLVLITLLCAYLAWDIISDRKRINQYTQLNPDTLVITNEFDIPVVMDTLDNREDSIPVVEPEVKQDTVKEPAVTEPTPPPCFVVVGAFSNSDNVTRMEERLKKLGYTSAQIKGGSLTRVAISTSCDKDNLQKVLNEARSGINPESWIY